MRYLSYSEVSNGYILFEELEPKAVYDSDGKKLPLDPKHKIYFLSNDFPRLTQRTTKDIKPGETPVPKP